jgi:hypothetical protein
MEQLLRWQCRDALIDAADDATSFAASRKDSRSGAFGIKF